VLDVTNEVTAEGRVIYRVAKVGAFTFERDSSTSDPERMTNVQCTYGALTGPRAFYGRDPLPESPVVNGVTITAAAVFGPDWFTNPLRHPWATLPMQRGGDDRRPVPDATQRRVTDVVGALTAHHLARPDLAEVDHAQQVRLAPGRLSVHQRTIESLRWEISSLELRLAEEIAKADAQAALLALSED
jgi:hypothetical protein